MRIYKPRTTGASPLPILVHYHGAGFVAGDLDTHDSIARYYCAHANALVVAVDYRLAPEHRFPSAIEDAYAALVWTAQNADEIGGDTRRIAVTGDSAGGNIAAVTCLLAKERGGPRIVLQALAYPQVDLDLAVDTPSRLQFGGGEYFLSRRDLSVCDRCT